MNNIVTKIFNDAYESAAEIEYNPKWKTENGYFTGAVDEPLNPGSFMKFTDDESRRGLMVGTRFGTVIVFEKFQNSTGMYYAASTPFSKTIRELIPGGIIGERAMSVITGGKRPDNNIGIIIEEMYKEFTGNTV